MIPPEPPPSPQGWLGGSNPPSSGSLKNLIRNNKSDQGFSSLCFCISVLDDLCGVVRSLFVFLMLSRLLRSTFYGTDLVGQLLARGYRGLVCIRAKELLHTWGCGLFMFMLVWFHGSICDGTLLKIPRATVGSVTHKNQTSDFPADQKVAFHK